jgi:hypothetical protein
MPRGWLYSARGTRSESKDADVIHFNLSGSLSFGKARLRLREAAARHDEETEKRSEASKEGCSGVSDERRRSGDDREDWPVEDLSRFDRRQQNVGRVTLRAVDRHRRSCLTSRRRSTYTSSSSVDARDYRRRLRRIEMCDPDTSSLSELPQSRRRWTGVMLGSTSSDA